MQAERFAAVLAEGVEGVAFGVDQHLAEPGGAAERDEDSPFFGVGRRFRGGDRFRRGRLRGGRRATGRSAPPHPASSPRRRAPPPPARSHFSALSADNCERRGAGARRRAGSRRIDFRPTDQRGRLVDRRHEGPAAGVHADLRRLGEVERRAELGLRVVSPAVAEAAGREGLPSASRRKTRQRVPERMPFTYMWISVPKAWGSRVASMLTPFGTEAKRTSWAGEFSPPPIGRTTSASSAATAAAATAPPTPNRKRRRRFSRPSLEDSAAICASIRAPRSAGGRAAGCSIRAGSASGSSAATPSSERSSARHSAQPSRCAASAARSSAGRSPSA